MVIAGRNPPSPEWRTAPGWRGLFRSLPLGPFSEKEALAYLATSGIPPEASIRINRLARGLTRMGVIMGTAAYMSPEQARGKVIDKRTDIWAFGCVLYEALTGQRAFKGDTLTDTLAAVVEHEPDWTELPPSTPAGIQRLLRRCLEKDPTRRLRDSGDARLELDAALAAAKPIVQ